MRRSGTRSSASGNAAICAKQMAADARAAHGDDADAPAVAVTERRAVAQVARVEAGDVAGEVVLVCLTATSSKG